MRVTRESRPANRAQPGSGGPSAVAGSSNDPRRAAPPGLPNGVLAALQRPPAAPGAPIGPQTVLGITQSAGARLTIIEDGRISDPIRSDPDETYIGDRDPQDRNV